MPVCKRRACTRELVNPKSETRELAKMTGQKGFMKKTRDGRIGALAGSSRSQRSGGSWKEKQLGEGGAGFGHRYRRAVEVEKDESWKKAKDHLYEVGRPNKERASGRAADEGQDGGSRNWNDWSDGSRWRFVFWTGPCVKSRN